MLDDKPAGSSRRWLIVAVVLAAVFRLYAAGTEDHQSPDTYHYARQAELLHTQGLPGIRKEADKFLNDPVMAAVPSISRTVFLGALNGWMQLTETSGASAVAAFSCALDIVAVGLVALVASEVLGAGAAVSAVVLYGASPAVLCMARHGWSDSAVAVVCLLHLLLAIRCVRMREGQWPGIVLAVAVALSFGVKETAFLQGLLVLLVLGVFLLREGRRAEVARLTAMFLVAMIAMFTWTAFAVGGAARVVRLFGVRRDARAQVAYAVAYQTGTVSEWLRSLWLSDPVTMTLAAPGFALAIAAYRRMAESERVAFWISSAVCCLFVVLPMTGRALYNVRWVAPVFGSACLLAAWGLRKIWTRTNRSSIAAAVFLVACGALSLWRYQAFIARPDLQDLSLRMILSGHN